MEGLEPPTFGSVDRCEGAPAKSATPDAPKTSDATHDLPKGELAARLARDPELAEVVSVWKLLDEPIRQAILALVRARPTD